VANSSRGVDGRVKPDHDGHGGHGGHDHGGLAHDGDDHSGQHTLRSASPTDISALHRLMRDFATYEKLEHRFRITEPELHAALFAAKPPLESVLVDIDGVVTGFALWYFTFGTFSGRYSLFVEDIFVQPVHRGRGIGLALFRHMARIALERRCIEMTWNVLDWNTPAIEFYRRIGAKPVDGWIPQHLNGDALAALAEGATNG
jgi:GNAT superfamily N-acetyltransferase